MEGDWLVRRLAPDSSPIEIESLAKHMKEDRLLRAMGAEAANIHFGNSRVTDRASWLRAAAKDMTKAVTVDWNEWKEGRR
jgi:hypothetical protein